MMNTAIIYTLGWTLIHSFWQLTVLAVLLYIIVIGLKDREPNFRYCLSLLFMIVSVSVTSLTFILMYRTFSRIPTAQGFTGNNSMALDSFQVIVDPVGFWQSSINFLQANVASLTHMYMIGVGLLLLRLGINYWSLHRLKNRSEPIVRSELGFLRDLIKKMNVRTNVDIRSSDKVRMPMVIGSLRPVILIPASLLTNTAPHIIEAILAHELAHIERHDFSINLIQSVIETLFFYHPAVWYFSHMARREREFCCDQRAVEAGCRREDLARALAQVGELQRPHELSMSLGGPSNDLLNRVKYLLGFKTSLHYVPTHSIWYYGSLLGVFLLFSIGKSQFFPSGDEKGGSSSLIATIDTFPQVQDIDVVSEVWVQEGHEISIDTIIEYRYEENAINQNDSVEMLIDVDTMVHVIHTDTIPGQKKTVIPQTDDKVVVIINGDTVSVHQKPIDPNQPGMRTWPDSVRVVQKRKITEFKKQKLDSLTAQSRQNFGGQQKYIRIEKKYLDSLTRNLPQIQSRIQSFQYSLPDSLHRFSFGTPHMQRLHMDSVVIRRDFSLDSILLPNGDVSISSLFSDSLVSFGGDVSLHMFSDSLLSDFFPPYSGAYGFSHSRPVTKEMKELDRKIRAKERELIELRREQQKKYREEYLKQKEGSKRE